TNYHIGVQNISITNIHQQVPLDIKPPSSHTLSPATPISISGTIAETLPLPTPQLWYAQLIPGSQLMDGSSGRIMLWEAKQNWWVGIWDCLATQEVCKRSGIHRTELLRTIIPDLAIRQHPITVDCSFAHAGYIDTFCHSMMFHIMQFALTSGNSESVLLQTHKNSAGISFFNRMVSGFLVRVVHPTNTDSRIWSQKLYHRDPRIGRT
ncbi:hypothetical protein WG66_002286, partial [Moniliophthora roreri]